MKDLCEFKFTLSLLHVANWSKIWSSGYKNIFHIKGFKFEMWTRISFEYLKQGTYLLFLTKKKKNKTLEMMLFNRKVTMMESTREEN
jgi:hypothetical protein